VRIPYWWFLLGPILLWALGFTSNAIVMSANNGQMPVLVPGGCTEEIRESLAGEQMAEGLAVHTCMTKDSQLIFLADWIVIRHMGVVSLGDLCEWGAEMVFWPFMFLWAFAMISDRNRRY
jgi:Family of unknown function (DUF5317)